MKSLKYLFIASSVLVIFSESLTNGKLMPSEFPERVDTVEVAIIGDVMMHARQLEFNHSEFLRYIAPSLKKSDIAVANMEFSLAGPPYSGYPCFSAPDSYAQSMIDAGIDVFLTANNHLFDHGIPAAGRTLSVYDSLGAMWTGSYRSHAEKQSINPLIINCKGLKIAIINFSYGSNKPTGSNIALNLMQENELTAMFESARKQSADFIIAMPHWGKEYDTMHNPVQEEWADRMIDAGANVIIGTHPHVIQDTTIRRGVPVIYSIGNAISNMSAPNTQLGYYATLRFAFNRKSGEKRMLKPELRFIWCSLPGRFCNNYSTIFVGQFKKEQWISPYDYDKMMSTVRRYSL